MPPGARVEIAVPGGAKTARCVVVTVAICGVYVAVDLGSWLPLSSHLPSNCVCAAQAVGQRAMIVRAGI